MYKKPFIPELLIIIAGSLLFLSFLGSVHLFDWDEINFAESAREMIITGDYLTVRINYLPFWEKPPLFIWFQVLSMKIFGINEFAARFPNAICGIVTMLVIYHIGRKLFDELFGLLWILVYIGSILPFFYFKSGIIDPWFNLFIFSGLVYFIFFLETEKPDHRWLKLILSSGFIGLAVLTKGPVAVLIFGLTVIIYFILNKFRININVVEVLLYMAVLLLVSSTWFIIQIIIGNLDVIKNFFIYQLRLLKTKDAGHGGFFLYHVIVLFFGVFPASIYALKSFRRNYYDNPLQKHFKYWMITLLFVVLIIFSIVRTKIIHYSSLCYFPLTFLGAYVICKIISGRINNYRWLNWIYASVGIIYGLINLSLPFLLRQKEWIIKQNWIKDEFAVGNLQAQVKWTGLESFIGIVIIAGVVITLLLQKSKKRFVYFFLISNMVIYILLNIIIITPKVEKYSQNALIEFCKERRGEDCYIQTLGMKSYAHYFYAEIKFPLNKDSYDLNWLLTGPVDKPVYFILRNKSVPKYMEQYPFLKLFKEKNGYMFLKRELE